MGLTVAIVGSGPGGFYSAAALIKELPDCRVDILDRLPTPFGLIRAGVAPDHQSSKKIAKIFERTAQSEQVRFLGNVEVGRDISVAELRGLYDAVVLATGAPRDRRLGIPGEDLPGVYGSSEFVGWYNAHPDFNELAPNLETGSAVVIGAGNVALDVARLLAKTGQEVRATDMAHYAADAIDVSPIRDIYVYARRGPLQAAFTHKEVKEFGELDNAVTLVDAALLPADDADLEDKGRGSQTKNIGYLRDYARNKGDEKPVRIHMEFFAMPVEILGGDQVSAIRMERTRLDDNGRVVPTGETFELPCNIVVACIGTQSTPLDNVAYDEKAQRFLNEDGRIEDGLYVAGWAKRGPSGTIATNFPDGNQVADFVKALTPDSFKQGPAGLDQLLADRGVRVVTFEDWKRIEAAEEAGATHGAPRRKFTTIPEMIKTLG
ncbi:MAG: pyridine nucleotide-disulfide oxidoreductase [Alphaproteobacteria bacterium]|nr:pyridine nucleotide-disulfide oxidoreductase [Alphaproteobacteria bacterium]